MLEDAQLPQIEKTVFWQTRQAPGAEICTLRESDSGWGLSGTVLTVFAGVPAEIDYRITCDKEWKTRAVHVTERLGAANRELHLMSDGAGRWHADGDYVPALDASIDVDLEVTPATNTLPIRRLQLKVGGTSDIQAAWVRFPELTVEASSQRYTRLAKQRYQYESRAGLFTAVLDVDELGLAYLYGDIWMRNAATTGMHAR
jgi:hypothetical protein